MRSEWLGRLILWEYVKMLVKALVVRRFDGLWLPSSVTLDPFVSLNVIIIIMVIFPPSLSRHFPCFLYMCASRDHIIVCLHSLYLYILACKFYFSLMKAAVGRRNV